MPEPETGQGDPPQLEVVAFDRGALMPFDSGDVAERHVDMDDYVAYPARRAGRYDLIFVDGRKRRRCLLEAASLLKPGGITVLHDAYRQPYHCALDAFAYGRHAGEMLWLGAQTEAALTTWIVPERS